MRVFSETHEKLIDTALLILRLTLGVFIFAHGAQKVLGVFGGKGLTATVAMIAKGSGIPEWLLYVSAFVEFLGGIGMVLGLLTRFWGVALTINMIVATMQLAGQGFFRAELPATFALIALAITLAGPGAFSLDRILFPRDPVARTPRPFPVPGGSATFRAN